MDQIPDGKSDRGVDPGLQAVAPVAKLLPRKNGLCKPLVEMERAKGFETKGSRSPAARSTGVSLHLPAG